MVYTTPVTDRPQYCALDARGRSHYNYMQTNHFLVKSDSANHHENHNTSYLQKDTSLWF